LESSSKKIGPLCPILVDHRGRIIDGVRRSRLNENWPTLRLDHVKTEKDRLIARIASNVVRRTVSPKEKTELLDELGQTYLNEGIEPGRISFKIVEETGMSYRWVAKYLPLRFKHGLQSTRASSAACRAADSSNLESEVLREPKRRGIVLVRGYSNTGFVSLMLEKKYYNEFERDSKELGVPTEFSILRALEDYQEKMKRALASRKRANQMEHMVMIQRHTNK
jgi:hypothetical protein